MPDELAEQAYEKLMEYAADLAETMAYRDGVFGHHKKGTIPVAYRTLSAAGTVPAIYRLNRCAPSPRLSVFLCVHRPDNAGN